MDAAKAGTKQEDCRGLSRGCQRSCGVPCENVCLGAARRCVRAVEAERASWHLFMWGPITLGHVWSAGSTNIKK